MIAQGWDKQEKPLRPMPWPLIFLVALLFCFAAATDCKAKAANMSNYCPGGKTWTKGRIIGLECPVDYPAVIAVAGRSTAASNVLTIGLACGSQAGILRLQVRHSFYLKASPESRKSEMRELSQLLHGAKHCDIMVTLTPKTRAVASLSFSAHGRPH